MSVPIRFQLTLTQVGRPVDKRRDGSSLPAFRTIRGDGVRIVGASVDAPEADDTLTVGLDCDMVSSVELNAYQNNDPALFDAIGSLSVGDRVNVWSTLEHRQFVADNNRIRTSPSYGRITAVQVIERAPVSTATVARRASFSEVRAM